MKTFTYIQQMWWELVVIKWKWNSGLRIFRDHFSNCCNVRKVNETFSQLLNCVKPISSWWHNTDPLWFENSEKGTLDRNTTKRCKTSKNHLTIRFTTCLGTYWHFSLLTILMWISLSEKIPVSQTCFCSWKVKVYWSAAKYFFTSKSSLGSWSRSS
jgi:hypothetical protein